MSKGINVGDVSLKYEGRTVKVELVINTDESLEEIIARVVPAARGRKQCMTFAMGGEFEREHSNEFWANAMPVMRAEANKGGVA